MKRFLVMDLFYKPDMKKDVIEWVEFEKNKPKRDGIYKVRLKDNEECFAYYCKDKFPVLGKPLDTPWIHQPSRKLIPLEYVTHWGRFE